MTVRLRAHHLLCMLTYVGKGYSAAFTANFDRICERLGRGEGIQLVDGPDDVCAPRLSETAHHCFDSRIIDRDREAADAITDLLATPIASGSPLTLDGALLQRLRDAFRTGTIRAACRSCEWHGLCTDVAGSDFSEIRLRAG